MAKKLAYREFLKSFELVPRVAVSLLIEKGGKVLLTKRVKAPFKGYWHLPGSFVLKGERLEECVKRVGREEVGVKLGRIELAGAFDDIEGDPRGHVVDLIYKAEIKGKPGRVGDTAEVSWFEKLPAKMGFNHRETLGKLGVELTCMVCTCRMYLL